VPPVPARAAAPGLPVRTRGPHRRTSLAVARATAPLPYPDAPAPVLRLAPPPPETVPAEVPAAEVPAAEVPAAAPAPQPATATTPAPAPAPAAPAPPAPATGRTRPEPLPPLPPNATVPAIRTSVDDLLSLARHGLAEASLAPNPNERYAAAHLSALRAAAAVIAARATPTTTSGAGSARRSRPVTAWVLLAALAPELGEWAAFFAAGAAKRARAETGLPGAVTAREADDLLRDAETFLAVVETKLGGAARPSLLDRGA
jgi:hypothetical protein